MASSEMDLDRTSLTTPEADLSKISTSEKPVASHSSPSPSCEMASSEMDLDRLISIEEGIINGAIDAKVF
eukprot:gene28545-35423_t